jgi:DNA invertase Pin-like site-specific DNA recombinase
VAVLDLGVDLSTPIGEAMANMAATFAQLERRMIGERTRAALAVKRSEGVRLGRPRLIDDSLRRRIRGLRARGQTMQGIADKLNNEGVPTARGGRWQPSTIERVLKSAV